VRKIKSKKPQAPTLRESWWVIGLGAGALAIVLFLLVRAAMQPKQEPLTSGWPMVAKAEVPNLDGFPPPREAAGPPRFGAVDPQDGEMYYHAGARWILMYDIAAPPSRAEVIFFLQEAHAVDIVKQIAGLTPLAGASGQIPGDDAYTGSGGAVVFHRGRVLVRVTPIGNAASPPVAAALEVDAALVKTFGSAP
jgi:hypothetical protein